jgi:hypothetical protein
VLSDTQLRYLDAALEDHSHVMVSAEVLRQLLAATRVAHAVAVRRREGQDKNLRGWQTCGSGEVFLDRADWNLDRALARYTQPQPQPQQVS